MSREAGRVLVVLHRTRSPVNAGAAARACANFGLDGLVLCDPSGFDTSRARRVAASAAKTLEAASVLPSLEEALDTFNQVVATTARRRHGDRAVDPIEAARFVVAARRRGERVALLFGNESSGLPAWAIERAHLVSRIPVPEGAPSLNLAQAVLVHAWEIARASQAAHSGTPAPPPHAPEPIRPAQLSALRRDARALLLEVGFLDPASPDRILGELERLLLRAHPSEREAGLLLSLLRRLQWHVHHPTISGGPGEDGSN